VLNVCCELWVKKDDKQHIHTDTSLIEIKEHCDEKAMKCKKKGVGGIFKGWVAHFRPLIKKILYFVTNHFRHQDTKTQR
jgi:hypothetical protein